MVFRLANKECIIHSSIFYSIWLMVDSSYDIFYFYKLKKTCESKEFTQRFEFTCL